MPGIAGIITRRTHGGTQQDLDSMLSSMGHETYYVGNRYVNPDIGLYLGWLAHPCSLGARMPLISPDKRFALIIVGENYSSTGTGYSPSSKGSVDATAKDLLSLYDESQDKFLERLNGWFCGVAVDLNLGKITLFNDRYGMSRVYVHEGKDDFIFASEAKALLRVRPALRTIDPASLAQYLRSYCVMGDKTLFKGVSLLPAGSAWNFSHGAGPEQASYFNFADWEEQPALRPDEFYEKFDATVSTVFPAYMESTSPVALSLTAGLDTRLILASACERDRRPLPCYTFGGLWGEIFDIQVARKLAGICNQPYEVIRLSDQFLKDFPTYAEKSIYISDGTHDAFGAHDVYFNQIARNISPVRLTGKFGSEVVRTKKLIPSFDFSPDLLQSSFAPLVDQSPSFDQISKRTHPLTRAVSEEIPWYEYGRVAVEQSKLTLRTPYMDNRLVKLMYQAPPSTRSSRGLQARCIRNRSTALGDVPTDMGKMRENGKPLGSFNYAFFWAMAKSEYIYLYSMPHWLTWVDRKLERLKPEQFLVGRQKYEAYRIWIKTHFAKSIRDILLNPRARCTEFFDRAGITKAVEGHTTGTHNYLREINKMLTLELIYSSLLQP